MIIAIPTNNLGHKSEIPTRAQNASYCQYVSNAGYDPILIPMEADPVVIATIADGLLLAGGIDIDPIYYGLSNIASFSIDPEKDAAERALFHTFREFGKPIFGICRGFQLIFREYIHQNKSPNYYFSYLENVEKHSQTGGLDIQRRFPSHQIRADVGGLFGGDKNLELIPVNSMHHQAVIYNFGRATKDLVDQQTLITRGVNRREPLVLDIENVKVLGWSMRGVQQPMLGKKPDYDNLWTVLEAAEIVNWGSPIMGVQWHPEELRDIRIIKKFFDNSTKKIGLIKNGQNLEI